MPNIADLLGAQLATPSRVLYRQFVDGAWRDYSAGDVAALAASWQTAFRRDAFAPEPWTVENGLLTPTLKIKRDLVQKRFAADIEAVYAGGQGD
jgi:long-subunit acyl-CoA synthetase (AMP-forming)